MKQLEYNDFLKGLTNTAKRTPLNGQIELTYGCAYKCVHCYCSNQPVKELGFSFWKRVLDEIYDLGGMELTLTGGDPLRHKDFLKIYEYAKKKGFLINIFTTGSEITDEVLNFLEKNPPLSIEITLNSLDRDNHERITNTKGAFGKVIENINKIKERGLPLVLKCNGLKENKHEILKIKKFTEKLLGKNRFEFDSFIFPGLNRETEPQKHRLSPNEIIGIEKKDPDMLAQRKKQLKIGKNWFNPDGLYHCNSWLRHYFITPVGILQFCHLSNKHSTNLKNESFKNGFDKFLDVLKEKYKADSKCINCEYKEYCYKCPARAYLETGNEESPVEYYCELAKATKEFMNEVRESAVKKCKKV
ncbi:MAG: radical SAM protein, partial [Candidatus Omnitrophota bacterium]